VAREAGVAIGTASRVLNHRPNVNEDARRKVVEAARRLNYVSLRKRKAGRGENGVVGEGGKIVGNIGILIFGMDQSFVQLPITAEAVQGIVLARLVEDEGRENVCLVYRMDSYGIGLAETVMARLDEAIDVVQAPYDPATADLNQVMDACDDVLGAANAGVVFITFEADGRIILDDAGSRGWDAVGERIFMVDGNKKQGLIDALANPSQFDGALGTAPSGPDPTTSAGQRLQAFQDRFMARYGEVPPVFAENSYDGAYVVAAAIQLAGDASDRASVRNELANLSTGAEVEASWRLVLDAIDADGRFDYLGVSGDVDFDLDTGDLRPPYYIAVWTIDGGAIRDERVETVDAL